MNSGDIMIALTECGIRNYLDGCNPDYQVHFDVGNRGFYFEANYPRNSLVIWELYEVGPSTQLGNVCDADELKQLVGSLK